MRNLFEYLIRHLGNQNLSTLDNMFFDEEMQKHIYEYEHSPFYEHNNRFYLVDGEYKRLNE